MTTTTWNISYRILATLTVLTIVIVREYNQTPVVETLVSRACKAIHQHITEHKVMCYYGNEY